MDISYNDLSAVEPSLLARAVNGLEEVDLNTTELTVDLVGAVIDGVTKANSRLKKLNISNNEMMSLVTKPSNLIARALNRLEEVEMAYNKLSTKQLETIFSAIQEKKSNLKKIKISCIDLSSLDPCSFSSAISRLEEVKIDGTEVTTKQVEGILFFLKFEIFPALKILDLSDNDLSKIDPDMLAKAVNKLEEVVMNDSQLTLKQIEAILTESLVGTSLNSLATTHPEGALDLELIGKARMVIKCISISKPTNLKSSFDAI